MGQRSASFLEHFARPFVAGGGVHVGRPLDHDDLRELGEEVFIGGEVVQAIEEARQARARDLWLYPLETTLDENGIALLAAAHNLLFLSHPQARRWPVSQEAIARVERYTTQLTQVHAPDSEEEVVARHTLLCNLFQISRVDVELECWAARYSFVGMEPPASLMRWPRLRRVQERRNRVSWPVEAELTDGQRLLLTLLLRASPLTDFLSIERLAPPFSLTALAGYLRKPRLRRKIAHLYLEMGIERVGPPLARAFWSLVNDGQRGRGLVLREVAELVIYLYVALSLTDDREVPRDLLSVLAAAERCGLVPDGEQAGSLELVEQLRRLAWAGQPPDDAGAKKQARQLQAALEA